MSSECLENSRNPTSAADRILAALKTRGPQTVTDLAKITGVCGEAVRQQLVRLAAEGLAASTSCPRGVGRPAQVWELTPAANRKFPDRHAEFSVTLIRLIRQELGEAALNQLIEAHARESRARYIEMLRGTTCLKERLLGLAQIRTNEGYMAEARDEGPNGFLFIENHCPIDQAATRCTAMCKAELETFRTVLGPDVSVEPTEHIVEGDRRCAYRIRPLKPESSSGSGSITQCLRSLLSIFC